MMNPLIKRLARIAAVKLKNTQSVPPQYRCQAECAVAAFGMAAIEEDFERWCDTPEAAAARYPITDYLRVIDFRLGNAVPTPPKSKPTPDIDRIGALAYRLTHKIPSAASIQSLLADFSESEIAEALQEYVHTLSQNQIPWAVKMFFIDGGGRSVILARKDEEEAVLPFIRRIRKSLDDCGKVDFDLKTESGKFIGEIVHSAWLLLHNAECILDPTTDTEEANQKRARNAVYQLTGYTGPMETEPAA